MLGTVAREFGTTPSDYMRTHGIDDLAFDYYIAQSVIDHTMRERRESLRRALEPLGTRDAMVITAAVLQWLGVTSSR